MSLQDDPGHVPKPPADALDQQFLLGLVGHSSRLAFAAIRPHFQRQMVTFDLRPAEFAALSLISANPGISQKRLADAIHVSPPNMATVLARLAERALVGRERHATDQRTHTLHLTPAGATLYAEAATVVSALEREATAMLSDDERTELLRLLRKVSGR